MTTTTNGQAAPAERAAQERKEPTYLFTEKYVSEKSEIARKFMDTRERLNANVDKANNFLVKRFYNIDHNTYLEGALPAKTKELLGLVASAVLRCDDCIFYHAIQAYRLGVTRAEQEESSERGPGCRRQHRRAAPAARLRTAGRNVRIGHRVRTQPRCRTTFVMNTTTINARPPQNSRRCGRRMPPHHIERPVDADLS